MTELLFSSLLALSLGSLLCLPMISVREIGRGFFGMWACIVGVLGLLALALLVSGLVSPARGPEGKLLSVFLVLVLVLLAVFWAALRWGLPRLATLLLVLSAFCGALALREVAIAPVLEHQARPPASRDGREGASPEVDRSPLTDPEASASPARVALRVASLLGSAMAVGTVTVAMVLGHWYLVQPKLPIAPLRRLSNLLIGVLVARLALSAWGFAIGLGMGRSFFGGTDPIPWEALILSQRLLFGFGGSFILAVMIRKTVALRATMSATGLLYIAILFVWVGEFLAIYLDRLTEGGLVV